jgi:DedD protein
VRAAATPAAVAPAPAEPIEKLTFFAAKQPVTTGGAKAAAPAEDGKAPKAARKPAAEPKAAPPEDAATETMRRTLQAEMDAHREPASAPVESPAPDATAPATATPVPGTRSRRTPPAAASSPAAPAEAKASTAAETKPAASEAKADGIVWIQVYSSTNGVHAREIAARLRKAGYKVALADFEKDGQTQTRVRVGPYPSRDKADPVAARLRREQRLDTWVTDSP